MKPEGWDDMPIEEKSETVGLLINSMRGRLILGQALEIAMAVMRSVPEPYTEVSNIEDMEMIHDVIAIPVPLDEELSKKLRKVMTA